MPIGSVDWIEEGMLGGTPARRLSTGGWEFDIRNQFFHGSHPLGWIRRWDISIDGRTLAENDYEVRLRDQKLDPATLPTISDIWWHPGEILTIRIPGTDVPESPIHVSAKLDLSTFFFTPEIDRNDVYPTFPLSLSAQLDMEDQRDP